MIQQGKQKREQQETEKRTAKETAERMIKKGKMTLEEIADYVPALSLDNLKSLKLRLANCIENNSARLS